jgi:hypothetical protein
MIKTSILALAIAASAIGAHSYKVSSNSGKTIMLASGGSNCPVYYGCPAPAPAPKGGGGGGTGGADNPQPHA